MIRIIVNLIGFSSNKNVGTLIFAKRLFRTIEGLGLKDFEFIYYAQESFDFKDFNIKNEANIYRVPNLKSPLMRILYEQTLFRFKLCDADYIYTPYMTIPIMFSRYKQLVTIHDMVPFMLNNKYSKIKLFIIKLETKLSAFLSHKILTVSNNSKKDICEILNVNNDKVCVVYNFINEDESVVKGRKDPNVLLKMGLDKPYFLTVATLQPGKNVERLIRSFAAFLKEHNNYQLCIVGNKGWGYSSIFQEVEKCGVVNDVIFTGYQNDDVLDILYQHCYGVVYVSLYEGFGIPPLEGFFHNKVAIVSNNSSLPEVVGNAAVLVDPKSEEDIANGFKRFICEKDKLLLEVATQINKFNPKSIVNKFLTQFIN